MLVASISFKVIASGGFYVLGQEQDELAANFSANEAFIGQMSQLNIWSYEVSASDIADMARHAENYVGNVIGWSDFYDGADSGIKKIEPSVARTGKLSCRECHINKKKKAGPDYFTPFLRASIHQAQSGPFLHSSFYLGFPTVYLRSSYIACI